MLREVQLKSVFGSNKTYNCDDNRAKLEQISYCLSRINLYQTRKSAEDYSSELIRKKRLFLGHILLEFGGTKSMIQNVIKETAKDMK